MNGARVMVVLESYVTRRKRRAYYGKKSRERPSDNERRAAKSGEALAVTPYPVCSYVASQFDSLSRPIYYGSRRSGGSLAGGLLFIP